MKTLALILVTSMVAAAVGTNVTAQTSGTKVAADTAKGPAPLVRHVTPCHVSAGVARGDWVLSEQQPAGCFAAPGRTQLLGPFLLDFGLGNDHKIKAVGVHSLGSQMHAVFADNDGNDRYAASARMIGVNSARSFAAQSAATCRERCVLPIEPGRPGEVFVLRGFRISAMVNDSHTRRLAVLPSGDGRNVEVVWDDGSGAGSTFHALVEYAYIPESLVAQRRSETGQNALYRSFVFAPLPKAAPGREKVIAGFDFQFTDDGHFLGRVGFDDQGDRYHILFQDKNLDDDAVWRVETVELRG